MANITKTATISDSGSLNASVQETALALSLGRLRASLVATALITNYSNEAKNQGSRMASNVRVPKRGTHTVKDKAVNVAATSDGTTNDYVDLTLNKHKYIDFIVEDFGALFAGDNQNYLSGTVLDAIAQLAEAIEADVLGLYTGAGRTLGTSNAGVTDALLREIRKNATRDKFSMIEPTYGIWGAKGQSDFLGIDKLVKVNESGSSEALRNAEIGRVYGLDNYVSNLVPYVAGSPDRENGMVFQRQGLGIAFMDMSLADLPEIFQGQGVLMQTMTLNDDYGNPAYSIRMTAAYDQDAMGTRVQLDVIYGVKVIRSELVYAVTI